MCYQCEKNPVYEFTNKRKVCKNCFIKWFDKKILYTIRKFEMADHNSVIFYKNSSDFRDAVLENVLKMFKERSGCEIRKLDKGSKVKLKNSKIAVSDTSDIISDRIIHEIINGKLNVKKDGAVEAEVIRPLYLMLDNEVLIYAKLKHLKFEEVKEKKDDLSIFIEEMEKKHPELKHSVVKSWERIRE